MLGTDNGCYREVGSWLSETYSRVLFGIRLNTQLANNDMAMSLQRLLELNDQNSLLSGFRNYNPLFRFQNWRAQRSSFAVLS